MIHFTRKQKFYLRKLISFTPLYKNIFNSITFKLSPDEQQQKLFEIVKYAIDNVPYYKCYSKFLTEDYKSFDITKLPLLQKEDIATRAEDMISREYKISRLIKIGTGGTTGTSVNLYQNFKESVVATAYVNYLYSLAGKNAIICTIREHDLKDDEPYSFFGNILMLAPNKINIDTIEYYWDVIKKHNVTCIHAFPTSVLMLCKLLMKKGLNTINSINCIIGSSEIFSDDKKTLAKECFSGVKIIDYYGQTEMVSSAIKEDFDEIKFIDSYGFTEFHKIDTTHDGNILAEIIATSFIRKSMPLIRYATGDYVEIDKNGRILHVIGRTSDFLIGRKGQVIPCIIENREKTMENVLLVQYYQDTPGKFIYNMIVNEKYSDKDEKAIYEDMKVNFGDELIGTIKIVDHIEKTSRGKHRKLIQKLDVNYYLNK